MNDRLKLDLAEDLKEAALVLELIILEGLDERVGLRAPLIDELRGFSAMLIDEL